MDYDKIIKELISKFDFDSEIDRKKAYQKCIEYADQNLDYTFHYNPFVEKAAETLGQETMRKDISRRMVEESGDEKLHLIYSKKSGPELTGNASGLSYLSEVIKKLSEATMNGEHAHFYYGEPPLYGNSFPLTIYLEGDDWFRKIEQDDKKKQKNSKTEYKHRDIDTDKIAAFLISDKVPPDMLVTPNKVYKVYSYEKYEDKDVWLKKIREKTDRIFIFQFRNDDNEIEEIGLDLDDEKVLFLTKENLTQLI
jgi:hypothetical protein